MAAARFLHRLPKVLKSELPSDTCMVCLRQYGVIESDEEVNEAAVRLPVSHEECCPLSG